MLPSSYNIIGESSYFEIKVESELETLPMANMNGDGVVNIQDLVIVASAFGAAEPDLNGDGVVNIQDLVIVVNAF